MTNKVTHPSVNFYSMQHQHQIATIDTALIQSLLAKTQSFKNSFYDLPEALANHSLCSLKDFITQGEPALHEFCKNIIRVLSDESGYLVLKHFPVQFDQADLEIMLFIFSCFLGLPSYANRDKKVIWPVINKQVKASNNLADGSHDRFGNSARGLKFHTDTSTFVGLLCVKPAMTGGENELLSAVMLHNYICEHYPDILKTLYSKVYVDRRGEQLDGEKPYAYLPVFDISKEGRLKLLWTADYNYTVFDNDKYGLPAPGDELLNAYALLEQAIDAIKKEHKLTIRLDAGDLLLMNNNLCLHNRTAYQGERCLLRTWVYSDQYETIDHAFGYKYIS